MRHVTTVIVGPAEHGVTRHAQVIARATRTTVVRAADVATADRWLGAARVYHWHFTDRLFGGDVDTASAALNGAMARLPAHHVVSLHDVPAETGTLRGRRRADAYGSICARADAVVVSSEHERRRLGRGAVGAGIDVIPLPVVPFGPGPTSGPASSAWSGGGRTVGILGFVYPGKGHAGVVAASVGLPADVRIVALGRASDGHDELVRELRVAADVVGRELVVTGYLDDASLAVAVDAIDVPVVPARAMSASASLATWLGAGRRPLARRNGYVSELSRLDPHVVTVVEDGELAAAMRRALEDPASTRRVHGAPAGLGLDAVAAAYRALYRRFTT